LRDAEAAVILTGYSAYFNRGPESPEVLINLISAAIAAHLFLKNVPLKRSPSTLIQRFPAGIYTPVFTIYRIYSPPFQDAVYIFRQRKAMKKFCRRPAHNKAIYGITRSLELRGNKADPVPSRIRKLKKAYRESTYRITLNTLKF
jgi:hypothetical protein